MNSLNGSTVWYYDSRSYYKYVLLNCSPEAFDNVRECLLRHGVFVTQSALSFRPASNGIQYHWYIRVGRPDAPPPIEEIEVAVHEGLAVDSVPAPANLNVTIDDEQLQADAESTPREAELRTRISELECDLRKREQNENQLGRELHSLQTERGILRSQIETERANHKITQQEAERLRQQVLAAFPPEDVEALRQQYDKEKNELKAERDTVRTEFQSYIAAFEPEKQGRERQIRDLENQNATLKHRNVELLERRAGQGRGEMGPKPLDRSNELSMLIVKALLPNVEFMRDCLDYAWTEFNDTSIITILSEIKNGAFQHGKRVQTAPAWREYYKKQNDKWRLYFRQRDRKYQVLVSDKDEQDEDYEWLKLQPAK